MAQVNRKSKIYLFWQTQAKHAGYIFHFNSMAQICAIWEYLIELFNLGGKPSAEKPKSLVLNGCENKAGQGQGTEVAASLARVEETNRNTVWASAKCDQHTQLGPPQLFHCNIDKDQTWLLEHFFHSALSYPTALCAYFTFFAKKTDLSHWKIFIAKETPCLKQSTTNSSFPIIPYNFPSLFHAWLLSSSLAAGQVPLFFPCQS